MNEAQALYTQAVVLRKALQLKKARRLLVQVIEIEPTFLLAAQDFGLVSEALDCLPEAFTWYLRFADDSALDWAVIGAARCALRLRHEAAARLLRHKALDTEVGALMRGEYLSLCGERSAAQAQYELALEKNEKSVAALMGLARCSLPPKDALALLNRAANLAAGDRSVQYALAYQLFATGQAEAALHQVNVGLAAGFHAGLVQLKARILFALGYVEAARSILSCDGVVQRYHLGNAALADGVAEAVLRHSSLMQSPAHHATVGGGHTGELFGEDSGPLFELEEAVSAVISDFYLTLDRMPDHLLAVSRPSEVALQAWGVALSGAAYQSTHVHPDSWLSAVYYAQVPMDHAGDGQLVLNVAPNDGLSAVAYSESQIQPEPGMLVLFPSWLWHQVARPESSHQRVSVAVDVMPSFISA